MTTSEFRKHWIPGSSITETANKVLRVRNCPCCGKAVRVSDKSNYDGDGTYCGTNWTIKCSCGISFKRRATSVSHEQMANEVIDMVDHWNRRAVA